MSQDTKPDEKSEIAELRRWVRELIQIFRGTGERESEGLERIQKEIEARELEAGK